MTDQPPTVPSNTEGSELLFQRARKVLPGGTTRAPFYRTPYPLYLKKANGCYVWDVDGNMFLDFVNNMGPLILGHRHSTVERAVSSQLGSLWCGGPTELEIELAETIRRAFPIGDKILFSASGSEAMMKLIRAVRSSSKKKKIALSTGAFHGTSDGVSSGAGIPEELDDLSVRFRYNDEESFRNVISSAKGELAAVIVEAVLGPAGSVPPTKTFIRTVRELTEHYGIYLILDEVVSGFRLARGGVSELFNIEPDGIVLGKIIGGGFPVGALLGRSELMREFDYIDAESPLIGKVRIPSGGTYNAHPVSMAAGLATLNVLTGDVYEHLNSLGDAIRQTLARSCEEQKIPFCVTGIGSIFQLRFTGEEITDYETAMMADERKGRTFDLLMLKNGVNLAPYHSSFCSEPMKKKQLDEFSVAARKALGEMSRGH